MASEKDDEPFFNEYKKGYEADKMLIDLAHKKGNQQIVDFLVEQIDLKNKQKQNKSSHNSSKVKFSPMRNDADTKDMN